LDVFIEATKSRTMAQSRQGRIIADRGDDAALPGWFNGFSRSGSGNFVGSFFLAKQASDIVIEIRVFVFKSGRTTRPGYPWTWSMQVIGGPRSMIKDKPYYSNRYFADEYSAAVDVLEDVRGGGYTPTQPKKSSVAAAIAAEHGIADRLAAAEDRAFARKPTRTRIIDT
jgi:hypothetical protein